MDAELRSAIALSHLGDLPSDVVDHLTANAVKIKLAAGSVSSREGEIARHLDLVVTGVVRVFVVAPDGRTMTVRYGPPGALIGAVSLFAAGYASPVTTQALVDAEP
jgi:CRP/FNR family transcriptional regulator